MLRGVANLKAVAIKLSPYFKASESAWTWELIRIMGVCKTVEYRVSSLKNITLTEVTLPYVLEKIKDVNEQVRCAVYIKLRDEKVELEVLELVQRYDMLLSGLMDYKESVRNACGQYLKANMNWIEDTKCRVRFRNYKSDAADSIEIRNNKYTSAEKAVLLMKLFDIKQLKNSDEYCICLKRLGEFLVNSCDSKDLTALFKEKVIPTLLINKAINIEGLVLMRISLDLTKTGKAKFHLDSELVLPEVSLLKDIITQLIADNNVFVLHEILLLFVHYNYSEPTIAQILMKILDEILRDVSIEGYPAPEEVLSYSSQRTENLEMEYQELVQDQLDLHRRDVIVRTMGDITYVILRVIKQLMGEINRFKDKLLMEISDLQEQLDEVRNSLQNKNSTSQRLGGSVERMQELVIEENLIAIRELKLAIYFLQTCGDNPQEEILQRINEGLITPALQTESGNEFIKYLAIYYLGLYSLLDEEKSKSLLPFFKSFIKGIELFQTLQGVVSLKAIFDIILIHAKRKKHSTPDKNSIDNDLVHTLHELQPLLYAPNIKLRLLVYEGYTKAIFCDKITSPERYLLLLLLVLADPMETEAEVNGIKQLITLALKTYTKLSKTRAKYLCNTIVIFTLLWMEANSDPQKVIDNTILARIMKCQYTIVVTYLIYLLTNQYIGAEVNSFVSEVTVQIIKVIITHVETMEYVQCAMSLCLRFIELDSMERCTQIVLYKHWTELIKRAKCREKEYYTFSCNLRTKILQQENIGEESQVMERRIDQIATEMAGDIKKVCEKLEKRYNYIESLSAKLFQEFNELLIDSKRGCIKIDKPHKQYQAGILTSHIRIQRPSNLEVMLETPKWVKKYSKKKPFGSSQKKRRQEMVKSNKKMKYEYKYPDSKEIIKEDTREEC